MDTNSNIPPETFWDKVKKYSKKAGKELIRNVLLLWFAFPEASVSDKAMIAAALLYFISPVDAIPDILPGGFTDDASIVALTALKIRLCASAKVINKVDDVMKNLFGEA